MPKPKYFLFYIFSLLFVALLTGIVVYFSTRSKQISTTSLPIPTSIPTLITSRSGIFTKDFELSDLQEGSTISSPLTLVGRADASWFFEGVFPVSLVSPNGEVIASTQAKEVTPGSWTKGGWVDFTATLNFSTTQTEGGLSFHNDNPSGLPQNNKSVKFNVKFLASETIWKTYKNDTFGFSVNYDPKLNPTENIFSGQQLALIAFGPLVDDGFDIEITRGDDLGYYKNQILDHMSQKINSEEFVFIGNIKAIKLTYRQEFGGNIVDVSKVIIHQNNYDYIITALTRNMSQILSTFKFTKPL